mgnify:CR=1 FL=1
MQQIHHDAIERRWEIKYLAYPYSRWTIEEHDEEESARGAFMLLWTSTPPAINLSMRSRRVDLE